MQQAKGKAARAREVEEPPSAAEHAGAALRRGCMYVECHSATTDLDLEAMYNVIALHFKQLGDELGSPIDQAAAKQMAFSVLKVGTTSAALEK